MVCALDLDGMLFSFPEFFQVVIPCLQKAGHKVGILTARKESHTKESLKALLELGIKPDFYIAKPDDVELPDGLFKATVCNEMEIDYLFDDFEADNPTMLADFFSVAKHTVPFTSWGYSP